MTYFIVSKTLLVSKTNGSRNLTLSTVSENLIGGVKKTCHVVTTQILLMQNKHRVRRTIQTHCTASSVFCRYCKNGFAIRLTKQSVNIAESQCYTDVKGKAATKKKKRYHTTVGKKKKELNKYNSIKQNIIVEQFQT